MTSHTNIDLRPDERYILAWGWALSITGLAFVVLGASCSFWLWGYCDWPLVSILSGFEQFRPELSMVTLPLAMLVLGTSLRLHTRLGWWVAMSLLAFLMLLFFFLMVFQLAILLHNAETPSAWVLLENILVNTGLCVLCALGGLYLLQPTPRAVFMGPPQGVAPTADPPELFW